MLHYHMSAIMLLLYADCCVYSTELQTCSDANVLLKPNAYYNTCSSIANPFVLCALYSFEHIYFYVHFLFTKANSLIFSSPSGFPLLSTCCP